MKYIARLIVTLEDLQNIADGLAWKTDQENLSSEKEKEINDLLKVVQKKIASLIIRKEENARPTQA